MPSARKPLFSVKGKNVTAENIKEIFTKLAGRVPTDEEMEKVRATLKARKETEQDDVAE